MPRIGQILLALIVVSCASRAAAPLAVPSAQPPPALAAGLDRVGFVEGQLASVDWGQYMATGCAPTNLALWDGFPIMQCRYPSHGGKVPVVLLDADNARMARWLVHACADAAASLPLHCAERLAFWIKCQSGNQFPVAGFVDEGPLFFFRDGMTAKIKELGNSYQMNALPTAAQETLALSTGTVMQVYKARIASTTREQYAAFKGIDARTLAGLAWQDEVRAAYQRAWTSDQNELISAWANANLARIDHKDPVRSKFADECSPDIRWAPWPITVE